MSEVLCNKCQKFFGNSKQMNLCSVCYKDHIKTEKLKEEVDNIKVPEIPPPPADKQADHSKCNTCRKKIGLLGFRCKGCDCSYCNTHRLPQDHKCEGDFIQMAKNQIKKKNPNITAPKIEQI